MFDRVQDWLAVLTEGKAFFVFAGTAIVGGVFAGMGFWRSRKDRRQRKSEKEDPAFFKGIQYILSNDQDHAIEEFTKSVKVNSDTIETYVALGNLYRSKGDIDRAIRIRQSIMLRPNVDERIRVRALYDLGLDYRKGGFLNRALKTLLDVAHKDPGNIENLREIEKIYEELREWEKAYNIRQRIAKLTREDQGHILAHHLVEAGKVYQEQGDFNRAKSAYNKALGSDKACVDAYLHLGDLYFEREEYKKAIAIWERIFDVAPDFLFLCYNRLERACSRMENLKPIGEFLKACVEKRPDAFGHMALARYFQAEKDGAAALMEIEKALELNPSLWEARRFKGRLLLDEERTEEALAEYARLLEFLTIPYLSFQCERCGFEPKELLWQCPQCRHWDSIKPVDTQRRRTVAIQNEARDPVAVNGGPHS